MLVADNVINTHAIIQFTDHHMYTCPSFVVKVSRPYFLTSPQGAHKNLVWGQDQDNNKSSSLIPRPLPFLFFGLRSV